MVPLPPIPKITEINCLITDDFVPFVEGWDQENCPVEVGENDFYATIVVKGENLTIDWLTNAVKGGYYNGGDVIESTIGEVNDYGNGKFGVDVVFAFSYGEGDRVKFEVDGVQSAWMTMIKAN